MKTHAGRLICLIVIAVLMAGLTGCGSSDANPPVTTGTSQLYTIRATQGTFDLRDDGSYTLRIENIDPYTAYYTETPSKQTGTMATAGFITKAFTGNTGDLPNGVIHWRGATGRSITVNISSVTYDEAGQTATYAGSFIGTNSSSDGTSMPRELIPREMSNIALSVNAMWNVSCSAHVYNYTNGPLTLVDFGASPGGGWTTNGFPGYVFGPNGGYIFADYNNAAVDCSIGVTLRTASGQTFHASFDNPWDGASTWGCSDVPSNLSCSATGNSHGQPLKVDFEIRNK